MKKKKSIKIVEETQFHIPLVPVRTYHHSATAGSMVRRHWSWSFPSFSSPMALYQCSRYESLYHQVLSNSKAPMTQPSGLSVSPSLFCPFCCSGATVPQTISLFLPLRQCTCGSKIPQDLKVRSSIVWPMCS